MERPDTDLTSGDRHSVDSVARRASSFGAQAAAYAEHRPDYPAAAIHWLLSPLLRDAPLRVLDLGAGTGKLTDGVLAQGPEVIAELTAVEPDDAMRGELTRRLPLVTALAGTAESIPLADCSVDAVLVGQAFHWFDPARALPEIARVLRHGGVLGALWNFDDDRVPWVAGLARHAASGVTYTQLGGRIVPNHPLFEAFSTTEFAHSHRRTADSLTATIGTYSRSLILPEEERATLLERVRGYLGSRPETASGQFDLPLVTTIARAVRR